jgi:Winged helix DNA-binding domain
MNAHLLIQAVMQQTTVFIAQLATSGGIRAPLSHVANQVFLDLSVELQNHGVKKNVIADMFGLALRTFHRKVAELSQSQSVEGQSVWAAVLDFVHHNGPVTAVRIFQRFAHDDREVVAGVLSDLTNTGLCYRAGRGTDAVYRVADEVDFGPELNAERQAAHEHLVWQAIYRSGPLEFGRIPQLTHLNEGTCRLALEALVADGRVSQAGDSYSSARIDVPVGQTRGWEAAVLDHYQALVSAVCSKLATGTGRSQRGEHTGGATFTLDLWPGHPLEAELLGTLTRLRAEFESLRTRLDHINTSSKIAPSERLVVYFGQHLQSERPRTGDPSDEFSQEDLSS